MNKDAMKKKKKLNYQSSIVQLYGPFIRNLWKSWQEFKRTARVERMQQHKILTLKEVEVHLAQGTNWINSG